MHRSWRGSQSGFPLPTPKMETYDGPAWRLMSTYCVRPQAPWCSSPSPISGVCETLWEPGGWCKTQPQAVCCLLLQDRVCVYYCRTYYNRFCFCKNNKRTIELFAGGGGGEWRTCAMIDDEPRPVWMSPLITH